MALPSINLALTAIDLLISTASVDSVAVLNGFSQVMANARPMRASVRQPSRLLDHPIETGQVITDYSVILPVEIDLAVIVQAQYYRSTCQEIIQLFQNKQLLTVQLKVGNFINMVVAEIPHEETPEKYDAFTMIIKFRQVLVVQGAPPFTPADPTQANTQALGQQSPAPISPVNPPPAVALTPGTVDYSSVPNLTSSGYTISGVATQNGIQTISNAAPAEIPVTGLQTITNSQSISSAFSNPFFNPLSP